jgi:quercetin dioxygenase-like cupin family protein
MKKTSPQRIATSLAVACLGMASVAFAGECPAGKAGANALTGAPTAPVGVTESEISSIDLAAENVKLDNRRLRLRKMTIMPGGMVPLHSHADRPALIMVNAGEVIENSSKCLVPIVHKVGDVSKEFLGTMHWWVNKGKVPVMLTISDIVNDKKPETMMEKM